AERRARLPAASASGWIARKTPSTSPPTRVSSPDRQRHWPRGGAKAQGVEWCPRDLRQVATGNNARTPRCDTVLLRLECLAFRPTSRSARQNSIVAFLAPWRFSAGPEHNRRSSLARP